MIPADWIFERTLPLGLLAAVPVALLLALLTVRRCLPAGLARWVVLLLRALFILLLGWCLLLPVLRRANVAAVRPRFLVALDASASMTLGPSSNVPPRWAAAQNVLAQPWTNALGARCTVELYAFAQDLGPARRPGEAAGLAPDGTATHLRDNLRRLADRCRGQDLVGLLLLSDGLDTREAHDTWAAEGWPAPVYAVRLEPAGAWDVEPDVRVDTIDTPRKVVVGWESKLTAVVSGQGTQGRAIGVQLLKDGALVDDVPVQIPADGGAREVEFRLEHPAVGLFTYAVQVPPLAGERQTNDNQYAVTVQVVDTRNRLLYVEGAPRWESKFLVRALQANPNVAPLAFVRGPGGRFLTYGARGATDLQLSRAQLAQFKTVVLGDLDAAALDAGRAENLVDFVERGGSLVLLGGPAGWGPQGFARSGLAKLLPVGGVGGAPVREGRFPVRLTDEGRAHPAFQASNEVWATAPAVLSVYPAGPLAAGATVLLDTEGDKGRQPVVAAERFGQGKVVAILTDSLWRWKLAPAHDEAYARFWSQLLDWLTPREEELAAYQVELAAASGRICLGEPVELTARLGGAKGRAAGPAAVRCEIQTPDGRTLPFAMSARSVTTTTGQTFPGYAVDFTAQASGLHRAVAVAELEGVKVQSEPYSFFVKPFTPETDPRPANVALLQALAAASGGRLCEPEEIGDVLAALQVRVREEQWLTHTTLWNAYPVLLALLLLLVAEWALRKFKDWP